MRPVGKLSTFILDGRRSRIGVRFNQTMFPFIAFFLCVSSGFGDDRSPNCQPNNLEPGSSVCDYVRNACAGDTECFLNLYAYLYRQDQNQLRFLHRCKDLALECSEPFLNDETKTESKRGILNKNLAYLLLKLNPFFNQTSQFGFLTSGRMRRITGNYGTEFLGKRSDKFGGKTRSRGTGNGNQSKVQPTATPRFYSLPLNKFAQAKVLKRDYEYPEGVREFGGKRSLVRGGHGGVILGSEFLGKRGIRDLGMGNPGGSLGRWAESKRDGESPIGDDLIRGSELLGKRNGRDYLGEMLAKKLVGNRLRKQMGTELLGKKSQQPMELYERMWPGYGSDQVAGEDSGQELESLQTNQFRF